MEKRKSYKTLQDIMEEIAEFSDKTFGADRPYTAPLHHLKKEIDETIESGDIFEYADCMLLLLDSFRKRHPGKRIEALATACDIKIKINRNREWGQPDENGVFQHVEKKQQ